MPYQSPTIERLGTFEELTKCMGAGHATDFLGCGYAWVVVW